MKLRFTKGPEGRYWEREFSFPWGATNGERRGSTQDALWYFAELASIIAEGEWWHRNNEA